MSGRRMGQRMQGRGGQCERLQVDSGGSVGRRRRKGADAAACRGSSQLSSQSSGGWRWWWWWDDDDDEQHQQQQQQTRKEVESNRVTQLKSSQVSGSAEASPTSEPARLKITPGASSLFRTACISPRLCFCLTPRRPFSAADRHHSSQTLILFAENAITAQ